MTNVIVRPGRTSVVVGGGSRVVTRPVAAVTAVHNAPTPVSIDSSPNNVTVPQLPTKVITGNAMGVQGPKGEPGGSVPAIAFSYGDAPSVVWTPDAPGILTLVRLKVTQSFNSPAAAIAVGTASDPDAALPSAYVDASVAEEYENTPDIRLAPGEGVRLTITPGGASQGAGLLFLTFTPD